MGDGYLKKEGCLYDMCVEDEGEGVYLKVY